MGASDIINKSGAGKITGNSGSLGNVMNDFFGSAPEIVAPQNRDYYGEMNKALKAQAKIQPKLIAYEAKYTPLWQQQQQQAMLSGLGYLEGVYNAAIPMSARLGGQMATAMAPAYAQAGQTAMNAYQSMFSQDALGVYGLMGQQARQGLEAGYGLTDQQTQASQQAARAAMSARGISTGNQAIAQEVLGSYNLSQNRYQQALANAQNYLNTSQNIASNAYGMYGQPLMAQMGQVSGSGLIGTTDQFNNNLGSKLFQPESQYNANIISANQSNQMNTALANAQIAAAQRAGNMQLAGSMFNSLMGSAGQAGGFASMFGA